MYTEINQVKYDEKRICSCFSFVVFCLFLTNLTGGLESITGIPHQIISFALKLIIVTRLLICVNSILHRIDAKLICSVIALCMLFLINAVCFRENLVYMKDTLITFSVTCFPMFALAYMIDDFDVLRRSMLKYSRISAVISGVMFIFLIFKVIPSFHEDQYSMGYGYSLLIPSLLLFVNGFEEKNIFDISLTVLTVFSIISLGSRGPILVIAVFAVAYYARKGIKQFLFTAIFIILLAVCFEWILSALSTLFVELGLESRTLQLLSQESVSMSGREQMYEFLKNQILINPFKIRGINAEYLFYGVYAHNLYLELLYQFGVVFGGLFSVALTALSFHEVFFRKNTLTLIYMCVSMIQLMVSSSLWITITFWCWMGFALKYIPKGSEKVEVQA